MGEVQGTDGAAEGDEALAELVERVRQRIAVARRAVGQVPLGVTVGAEVDAAAAELRRLERAGVTEADRPKLEALHARATRTLQRARTQARDGRGRTVRGIAGVHLAD